MRIPFLLAIVLLLLLGEACDGAGRSSSACPEATCGSLSIRYPFHLGNTNASSCIASLQEAIAEQFRLVCENDTTLYFPINPNYRLRVIFFFTSRGIMLDSRLNGSCNLPNLHAFDLSSTHPLFSISSINIIQLFNCSSSPSTTISSRYCTPNCTIQLASYNSSEYCIALGPSSSCCNTNPLLSGSQYSNFSAFQACSTFIGWRGKINRTRPSSFGLKLDWGLPGQCPGNYCSENAVCQGGASDPLHACHCDDGYEGDGYIQGAGCTLPQAKSSTNSSTTKSSTNSSIMSHAGGCTNRLCGKRLYMIIGFAILGSLALIVGAVWVYLASLRGKQQHKFIKRELAVLSQAPVEFSYDDLAVSTNAFKTQIGRGGFGTVYKGVLSNNDEVAVKVLKSSNGEHNEGQFLTEVATIGNIHHLNLVRLVGFCYNHTKKILVYEYVVNGSLEQYLFSDHSCQVQLDWEQRFQVALGTARGLAYLHEECRQCIIHCDIKPQNILLDAQFNPKISDFGLALLMERNLSKASASAANFIARGTPGYTAPELAQGTLTAKCDVYSFGMVLLEMIGGRENLDLTVKSSELYFRDWAINRAEKGDFLALVAPCIANQADMEEVKRAVQVAFWCIQDDPALRPKMSTVVKCLEGTIPVQFPLLLSSLE